jgi:hypothetical protein
MKIYTAEELTKILEAHQKWLDDAEDGTRADLSGANLSGANLSWADLSRANLSRANLSVADLSRSNLSEANLSRANLREANLSGANRIKYCTVSWPAHGECGRPLTVVKIGEDVVYFCGCFRGSESDLAQYIAKGDPKMARTRTLAFEFCRDRMVEMIANKGGAQ